MKYTKGSFLTIPNKGHLSGLDPYVQSVYMWICSYADDEGLCFPSRTTLARMSGCSTKSVDRAIEILSEKKILSKTIRKDKEKNLTNLYQIEILEGGSVSQSLPRDSQSPGVGTDSRTELNPVLTKLTEVPALAGFDVVIEKEETERDDLFEEDSPKVVRLKENKRKAYDSMISWAEEERGFPFLKTARIKQYAAFKEANANGIKAEQLRERWLEMANEKFWARTGFDWTNVVKSFNTRA